LDLAFQQIRWVENQVFETILQEKILTKPQCVEKKWENVYKLDLPERGIDF
jgi:hypothetical protein